MYENKPEKISNNSNKKESPTSSPLDSNKKLPSSPTQPELIKSDSISLYITPTTPSNSDKKLSSSPGSENIPIPSIVVTSSSYFNSDSIPTPALVATPSSASNIIVPLSGIKLRYINEIINYIGGRNYLQNKSTRGVHQKIFELTKSTENSFCEMLESNDQLNDAVGEANVFISHLWDNNFLEVIDLLQDYFRKDEDDGVEIIIWFDIFSKDFHKSIHHIYWSEAFKEALSKIRRTVMVLSPWNNPIPLTRAWCLWELYCTVITGSEFEIAMTNESKDQFIQDMLKDPEGGINKMLSNIDVEKSEASVPDHKNNIFEAIYQHGGFSRLNTLVCQKLREWVIKTMKEERSLPNNFSNPVYINSLALLYQHQGTYEEAQPLFEQCLKDYKENLGENHPQTLTATNNLGRLYMSKGDFDDAIFHLEKCLQLRKEILGENHPDTITTMTNLGMVYMNQNNYDLAEPYFQKCYDLRKSTLGSNHSDTLRSMEHLGRLYLFQRRDAEAKNLLEKCLTSQLNLLTKNHPDTLTTMNHFGMVCHYLGDSERAFDNLSYSVEWQKQTLGENHPNTLRSMNNLGIFYMDTDRIKDAQLILIRCYELRSKSLGKEHPRTLDTKNNIKELISKMIEKIYDEFPSDFKDINEDNLEISNTLDLTKKIEELHVQISTLETDLMNKNNEIQKFGEEMYNLETNLTIKNNKIEELQEQISTLETDLNNKENKIQEFIEEINQLKILSNAKNNEIEEFREKIYNLETNLTIKNNHIQELQEQISKCQTDNNKDNNKDNEVEELKFKIKQLETNLEEYYYNPNFIHDNPEVKNIIAAVDGNFLESEKAVRKFINHVTKNNIEITIKDANTIIACYLINRFYYAPMQALFPPKVTRGYLEAKGAQIPDLMTNQLSGNKGKHALAIYKLFKSQNLLERVDQDLLQAFNIMYQIQNEIPIKSLNLNEESKFKPVSMSTSISGNTLSDETKENIEDINNNNNNSNNNTDNNNVSNSSTSLDNTQFLSKENYLIREKLTKANKNELLQLMKDKKIIIIIGSGISLQLTNGQKNVVLGWNGLLDELKKKILGMWSRKDGDAAKFFNDWENQNEFEKAAMLVKFSESHPIGDYKKFVLHILSSFAPNKDKGVGEHTSILTALSYLGFPIVTTNYEYIAELELNRTHHNMNPSPGYEVSVENHHNYIFHSHGIIHEANNIILEENITTENDFLNKMETFFPGKSFLFVGCQYGAFDSHFTHYYKKHPHLKHFLLSRNQEIDDLVNHPEYYHKIRLNLERGTINPIIYGNSYEDLGPFIWNLLFESGVNHIPTPINRDIDGEPRDIQPHIYRGIQRIERDYDGEKWITTRRFYPSFSQFNQIFYQITHFKNEFPKIFQLFSNCTLSMSVALSLKWISENSWKMKLEK